MTKQQARTLIREIDSDPDRYLSIVFCGVRYLPAEIDEDGTKLPEIYGVGIATDYWQDTVYDYQEARAILRDLR